MNPFPSRRDVLRAFMAVGGAALLGKLSGAAPGRSTAAEAPCPDPFAGGRLVGTLRFSGADTSRPFHRLLDSGLDARLYTDLSTLTSETLVTPNDKFFVRTGYPGGLDPAVPWEIRIDGLVKSPVALKLETLRPLVVPSGTHLLECAGNNNPGNFGLMSAARWAGVPMSNVLAKVEKLPRATRVRVSGVDPHSQPSRRSIPGASWIFTFDELESSGAFLATAMNGERLPRDHGFPVRLIVPRWYGCACIKWVNEITLVDDMAPSSDHMKEFAARTFQDGVPALAKDFRPASMDLAAMPIRIEKWLADGKIAYRVVGIMWGGSRPSSSLLIRFNSSEPFVPVEVCPAPTTTDTWTLWSHLWRPASPGRYQIVLKVSDPTIPTRRLDLFFYTREVWVDEV